MTKKNYLKPEVEEVSLHLEGCVLSSSVEGQAEGEDIVWGTEFNPWA